jgi:hypothetical protein
MGNFKEDIVRTEAFVFDVDGVMTDGGIIPTLDGDFIRRYNAKDGYALAYAIKMGYKVCIITGGRGKTLENRLKMLGVTRAYIDCMDKISALHEYFAEEDNLRIIRRLRAAGLQFEAEARRLASEALAGRSFVVSGKFTRSRDEMKELIELHGGRNLAAVSGSVDYLVAGDKMGPAKLKKAEKLGVRIISEEEFIAMIEGGGPVEKAAQQELF